MGGIKLTYQEFTNVLSNEIALRGNIKGELIFNKTLKNNGVFCHNMVIKEAGTNISPSLRLDYFYDEYLGGRSLSDICECIESVVNTQPDFSETDFSLSWKRVKDSIIYVVINRESNEEYLRDVPHIDFLDFSIVFKIDTIFLNIAGMISITNEIMDVLGVGIGELTEAAKKNTPLLMPIKTLLLPDMIEELCGGREHLPGDFPDVLVCTNEDKHYGASCILYDDFSESIDEFDVKDCYVIPSSVHEVLLIKDDGSDNRDCLEDMVRCVNEETDLPETDFLSNRVYKFSEIKEALAAELYPAAGLSVV